MGKIPGSSNVTGRVNKPGGGRPLAKPAAPAAKKPGSTGMKQQVVQKAQVPKPPGMGTPKISKPGSIKR